MLETKYLSLERPIRPDDAGLVEGYASLFDRPDEAGDIVAPCAFAGSLASRPRGGVKFLWQHDPLVPIGVWMRVAETRRGLFVRGRIVPETRAGADALALLSAGALDGLSIGFKVMRAERAAGGGGRILKEIDLWEISLVTFPSLGGARLRSVPAPPLSPASAPVPPAVPHASRSASPSRTPGRGHDPLLDAFQREAQGFLAALRAS